MATKSMIVIGVDAGYATIARLDPEARPNWFAHLLVKIKGREWWTPFVDKPGLKRELALWSTGLVSGAPLAILAYYFIRR